MIDLDHFKRVNDTHGHPAGDAVLRAVGRVLKRAVRAEHAVARYGGEEFVVILSGTPPEIALKIADRIRQRIDRHDFQLPGGGTLHLTVSVGISQLQAGDTPDDLVSKADQALYRAKAKGRNRIEVYRESS
jgi:diguanylate cyclase (GGDEF)-like protein